MIRKVLAVTLGLVCALAALSACGGGSKKSSGSSSGKDNEFTKLYAKKKDAKVRITYENHDTSGAVSDTWTYSQDGATKSAYIHKDNKIVVNGDTVSNCDINESEVSCTPSLLGPDAAKSLAGGYAAGLFGFEEALINPVGDFGKVTDKTIAGRSAKCVEYTIGGSAKGIAKSILNASGVGGLGWSGCVDKDSGFLLSFKALGAKNDKAETIATKVEDPKDDDFATPTTSTTTETTDTTEPDSSGADETTTTVCTTDTLPGGGTVPGGGTIPYPCGALNN